MQCVSVSWAGFAPPPLDFWCGFAAAAVPNVLGDIHCTVSCNSIVKDRGAPSLAVGSSRKDAHAGTLPVVYL